MIKKYIHLLEKKKRGTEYVATICIHLTNLWFNADVILKT